MAVTPFPFIVGVGRSGTTLLRSILDAHADLAVVHESRFVAWMARNRQRYEAHGEFDRERFLDELLERRVRMPSRLHTWGVEPDAIRVMVAQAKPCDLSEAIRVVYRVYAEMQGKLRYGDKTPGYVRHMGVISKLLPEARFVHLVRDGRDVALSMFDVDFGGVNVPHAAWLWARHVNHAQQAGRMLGPTRYLLVRYEDLIVDPESALKRICGFVALPFDPGMVRYFERRDGLFRGLGDQSHHDHLRLPVTKGLRDWTAQMDPAAVAQFETIAGSTLDDLGYERATVPANAGAVEHALTALRIAAGRGRAALRAHRRVRRAR